MLIRPLSLALLLCHLIGLIATAEAQVNDPFANTLGQKGEGTVAKTYYVSFSEYELSGSDVLADSPEKLLSRFLNPKVGAVRQPDSLMVISATENQSVKANANKLVPFETGALREGTGKTRSRSEYVSAETELDVILSGTSEGVVLNLSYESERFAETLDKDALPITTMLRYTGSRRMKLGQPTVVSLVYGDVKVMLAVTVTEAE